MRCRGLIALAALAGCATPTTDPGRLPDLAQQRRAVEQALTRIEAEEAAAEAAAVDDEAGLERALERRDAAREKVLAPLAANGNAEAMFRLSWPLRDSADPAAIRQWLTLVTDAAADGHPAAHDELARWWWHQTGDGSIAAVQRYRARALDHATAAAQGGQWHAITRIGVYVAGDVHQYPASLPLATQVLRLCARGGHRECQERLSGQDSYAYATTAQERDRWRAVAERRVTDWRPEPWAQLAGDWERLRAEILIHGEASVGVYGPCTTMTPWCRGAAVDLGQAPDTPRAAPPPPAGR